MIYEAMAHSMPIVTTPVGSIPALMKDGVNCLFVQPGDADGLVNRIQLLIGNVEMRKRIGSAGADTFSQFLGQFRGKSHADQIVEMVRESEQ